MTYLIDSVINFIQDFTGNYRVLLEIAYQSGRMVSGGTDITVIQKIIEFLKPLGVGILVTYSMIEIVTSVVDSNQGISGDPTALILKNLFRMLFGYIFIGQSMTIANAGFYMWNSFGENVKSIVGDTLPETWTSSKLMVAGFLTKLLALGPILGLGIICQLLASAVIAINIMMAKLELEARMCYLPIALAQTGTSGGLNNTGFRYIKGMMSLAMYWGGCMIIITLVGSMVNNDLMVLIKDSSGAAAPIVTGLLNYAGSVMLHTFVGPFAAVSACGTLKSILKDALGG